VRYRLLPAVGALERPDGRGDPMWMPRRTARQLRISYTTMQTETFNT
jgi:hypothetical protein